MTNLGFSLNANIEIGDIILINSNTKFGNLIKKVTCGEFSHASMIFNHGKIIEALTSSVQATSVGHIQVRNKNNIKILRLKSFSDEKYREESQKKICEYASNLLYKKYDFKGAFFSIFEKDEIFNTEKFFCSYLVSDIFNNIGVKFFQKKDYHIVPNDFISLIDESLEDVSEKVLSPIPEWNKYFKEDIEYLDEGKNTSFKEAHLLSKFMTYSLDVLEKHNIGLTRAIKVLELFGILVDLENLVQKQNIDREFYEYYEKLKINSHVEIFFNNLINNDFDYEKFESEIRDCDLKTILIIIKNLERNNKKDEFRKNEFQAYQEIIKMLDKENYKKFEYELIFTKQLLDYYDIYLDVVEKSIVDSLKKIQILYKIGEIKYKELNKKS